MMSTAEISVLASNRSKLFPKINFQILSRMWGLYVFVFPIKWAENRGILQTSQMSRIVNNI
jgi:hypothetical protein